MRRLSAARQWSRAEYTCLVFHKAAMSRHSAVQKKYRAEYTWRSWCMTSPYCREVGSTREETCRCRCWWGPPGAHSPSRWRRPGWRGACPPRPSRSPPRAAGDPSPSPPPGKNSARLQLPHLHLLLLVVPGELAGEVRLPRSSAAFYLENSLFACRFWCWWRSSGAPSPCQWRRPGWRGARPPRPLPSPPSAAGAPSHSSPTGGLSWCVSFA